MKLQIWKDQVLYGKAWVLMPVQIVVVPKKAPPGAPENEQKQLVIDYQKLNQQLPFVQKADSNAKGVIV